MLIIRFDEYLFLFCQSAKIFSGEELCCMSGRDFDVSKEINR